MSANNARVTHHNACAALARMLDLKAPCEALDYVHEALTPSDA
jgi:hypothetical protein